MHFFPVSHLLASCWWFESGTSVRFTPQKLANTTSPDLIYCFVDCLHFTKPQGKTLLMQVKVNTVCCHYISTQKNEEMLSQHSETIIQCDEVTYNKDKQVKFQQIL